MTLKKLLEEATPAPWKLDEPVFGVRHIRQDPTNWDGKGYQHICTFPADRKGTHYGDMFDANARLIVYLVNRADAFVELVEAGKEAVRIADNDGTDFVGKDSLRAALRRVEGR